MLFVVLPTLSKVLSSWNKTQFTYLLLSLDNFFSLSQFFSCSIHDLSLDTGGMGQERQPFLGYIKLLIYRIFKNTSVMKECMLIKG